MQCAMNKSTASSFTVLDVLFLVFYCMPFCIFLCRWLTLFAYLCDGSKCIVNKEHLTRNKQTKKANENIKARSLVFKNIPTMAIWATMLSFNQRHLYFANYNLWSQTFEGRCRETINRLGNFHSCTYYTREFAAEENQRKLSYNHISLSDCNIFSCVYKKYTDEVCWRKLPNVFQQKLRGSFCMWEKNDVFLL